MVVYYEFPERFTWLSFDLSDSYSLNFANKDLIRLFFLYNLFLFITIGL